MSNNIPEKENNFSKEDFSTVFSEPTQYVAPKKKIKKKRLKIALAAYLAVAVLVCGTFAVIKLIPEKQDESTDNTIYVLNYETDDIKNVTLKNQNGKFKFYSKETEGEGTESGETVTVTNWYMDGYDKEMTDSDLIENVVDTVCTISAIREIDTKSYAECGLEKPTVTVDITTSDDKKTTLLVGAKSSDNAGVYVKLKDEEKIYLTSQELDEDLNFKDLDFASTEAEDPISLDEEKYSDYYENSVITSFDKITVSGKNFQKDVVITLNDNETISSYIPYTVIKPIKRDAENVDGLLAMFSTGFTVNGAYSYDVSSKTINSLGLKNPDFVLTGTFGDYDYSFKFKKQADGDYAVIGNDSKNVKKVSVSDCPFLEYETTDFYSKTLFMASIDNVSNFTIKTGGKTYSFDIKENPEGDDDVNKYIVKCDGKQYNSSYFQSYYQFLMGLQILDFETSPINDEPELTIVYTYNVKGINSTTIRFYKDSAVKYQYTIDGVAMGRIGSSNYKKIIKNLERLLDGKQITVN